MKVPKGFNAIVLPMVSRECISIFIKKFLKLPEVIGLKVEVGKFSEYDSNKSRTG